MASPYEPLYRFDQALALTSLFLEKGGGKMNDIKLAKLQYLTERTAILVAMAPVCLDQPVSLFHGPCLHQTLNLTSHYNADERWAKYLGWEGYDPLKGEDNRAVLIERVDASKFLSEFEIGIIDDLWLQFKDYDKTQIRSWCHRNCKEYREVEKGKFENFNIEDIFIADGATPEAAKKKVSEILYHERFSATYEQQARSA